MAVELAKVKDTMFKLVSESAGMKKWKATDLHKSCEELFGDEYDKRKEGKEAIKELIEEGKLVYTYFGGSYIEVPHKEGAANE
ncbi:hypothetical protein D9V86_10980 [Bacteroidetes/Chlorobi group bacterium ChocPot_Mid]|jgi:hypothetical protein|nr:MAG: hypothetical protein D9V86_10980 [Bacteroidetes/Chlorobi group bacterium ChocPot_Mid]